MFVQLSIFHRGWVFRYHEIDIVRDQMVYLQCARYRRGRLSFAVSLESTDSGGIQFRVSRHGKTQGWILRGPVEHWEVSY